MRLEVIRGILSIYTTIAMVTLGFFGIMVIYGIIDDTGASAAPIIVDKSGNGDYVTIHEAVENASSGATIRVWAGYYKENIDIYTSINLIGNGSSNTTIDGGNTWDPTIYIGISNVNVSGFNLINSSWSAIEISYSSQILISNNSFVKNFVGVELYYSDNVTFLNNNFTKSNIYGIYFSSCTWCNAEQNLFYCKYGGAILEWSSNLGIYNNTYIDSGILIEGYYQSHYDTHEIDSKNKINGKSIIYWKDRNGGTIPAGAGQVILADCKNIVVQNQNCSNTPKGIHITFSDYITIKNNKITKNSIDGLYCMSSENLTISDNEIRGNENFGLRFESIQWSNIENNSMDNNWDSGLYFQWQCHHNIISNNTMNFNNETGLFASGSSYNNFIRNNISSNNIGISFEWEVNNNNLFENKIAFNTATGIDIFSWCFSNTIYHNNFFTNPSQASDQGSNRWSSNGEGNYWSDYLGTDNGAGGRPKGDGIGDTNLPHPGPGLDNNPFIIPNGWRYPGEPVLYDPGDLDSDGNYSINWANNPRAVGCILQEDDSASFDSPNEVFNGSNVTYNVINQPEGTYYYRLRVYNDFYCSNWSSIVNITVDYLPFVPTHLHATVFPQGNTLYLSWNPNLVDTTCYELFYKTEGLSDWQMLANITHPDMNFLHDELTDGQVYQYKIRSRDSYWQASEFSVPITAIPGDTLPPAPPEGLKAEAISDSKIKLSWNASLENDLDGYIIYMHDPLKNDLDEYDVIQTMGINDVTYLVENLVEQTTYYFKIKAFDEVPNNSTFSNTAFVTPPDETHPLPPTGLEISNITHDSLTISWEPNSEKDVVGYIVYSSKSLSTDFNNVSEILNTTNFLHTGLEENTIYYYKVRSIDDADLFSLESVHIFGMTRIGPKPPEINNSIKDFEIIEDLKDDETIALYHLFKDVNHDVLSFRCDGQEYINVTINQKAGFVSLKPKNDWNGEETLTFYANDSYFEISFDITITVTGVNDPPVDAKIIKPERGFEVVEGKGIDLQGSCFDPDVLYGDVLEFNWKSSISDELGVGENLTGIKLPTGEHLITLEVSDRLGQKAHDMVRITVLEKEEGTGNSAGMFMLIIGVIVVVIIVLVLLFLLVQRSRKRKTSMGDELKAELAASEQAKPKTTETDQTTPVAAQANVQVQAQTTGDAVFPEHIQQALQQQAQFQQQMMMRQLMQMQIMQQEQQKQQRMLDVQDQKKQLPPKTDE